MEKEKSGSSKLKTIIIVILLIAVCGLGGYFGYNKFLKDNSDSNKVQTPVVQTNTNMQTTNQSSSYLSQIVSSETFELDEVTVNLTDEDSSRYLKASIYLGYDNSKLTSELEDKKPIITDAVISILRSKKAEDIVPKNMENIKMEIIQRINPMLKKGKLNNVYFTDLIVQ